VRALLASLLAIVAGCGGAAAPPPARPAPASAPARAPATPRPAGAPASAPAPLACRPDGHGAAYTVAWPADVRAALDAALERGGVVVAYDCATLRLLPGCRAPGGYGFMPTVPAQRPLALAAAAEVRANVPAASAGTGAPAAPPAKVEVTLTVAGFRDLTGPPAAGALTGACAGATHVVRRAVIGLVGDREAAGACDGGPANAARPPAGCDQVLRVTLAPLGGAAAPEALGLAAESCPAGLADQDDVCRVERAGVPHACTRHDPADCARQCELGHGGSCNTLGFILRTGTGVRADAARATALFARACELGSADGCASHGLALRGGHGGPPAPARAAAVLARACALGHAGACAHAALLFERGAGVARDLGRAATFHGRACTAGHALGCRGLAGAYLHGDGVGRDPGRARALLERTCELGERTGCLFLGVMLREGQGGPAERARAQALFRAACQDGLAEACVEERR
jgi:hypothetical protein